MCQTYETLHEYYRSKGFLPTYGGFETEEHLGAHQDERTRLFRDRLSLPARLFQGAAVLEFGPDVGENSLVFARWGADCTLVEPNVNAHPHLISYFERFGLSHRLVSLEARDLATFDREYIGALPRFDFIDAEGFIYTVRPTRMWLRLLERALAPDGFAVISYMEAYGGFLELFWKVIQAWVRQQTGLDPLAAARLVFQAKWDSIPHRRTMASWVMDVLENPFVRLEFFLDASSLCREGQKCGLGLYSSWPSYRDGLDVSWFKTKLDAASRLAATCGFIERSRLSYVFGRTHFLARPDAELGLTLGALLQRLDALVDGVTSQGAAECADYLGELTGIIGSSQVVADAVAIEKTLDTISSLQKALQLMIGGTVTDLASFTNSDPAFIKSWGAPAHFAVFSPQLAKD